MCGSRLSEDDYDADARELCRQRSVLAEQRIALRDDLKSRQRKLGNLHWWERPFHKRWEREAERMEARLSECGAMAGELSGRLKALPASRYHVSEWFQCTHIPLRALDWRGQIDFRLDARYTGSGQFRLAGKDVSASGYEGEHVVFEALRKRITDSSSSLHGARLLPNLFLPRDGSEVDMRAGRWRQVDCVVATDRGLFVIEVKRWNARVSATASYDSLFVERKGANNGVYAPADQVMGQIAQTADALDRVSPYPEERVCRAVVFVRPREFECPARDFVGNQLVSWADFDEAPFVEAIERQLSAWEPLFDEGDIGAWADDILLGFGDLSGDYRRQAEGKRFEAKSYAAAHEKSSPGTRAKSARAHHAKKGRRGRGGSKCRSGPRPDRDDWDWWFEERSC